MTLIELRDWHMEQWRLARERKIDADEILHREAVACLHATIHDLQLVKPPIALTDEQRARDR